MTTFALRSNRVLIGQGMRPATIIIEAGRIRDVLPHDTAPDNLQIKDYGASVVMPGLVDVHVHLNEPGREDWEGFQTGTRAAALGGVTTLCDMPLNSSPVTTTVEALNFKREAAQGKLSMDCGFHGGLVPQSAPQIEALLDAGVLGIKAFLIDSGIEEFGAATTDDLRAAMPILAARGVPLLVHAELDDGQHHGVSSRRYADYLKSRPPEWELRAIRQMIELCREFDCPVHLVHLSTAEALPMLRDAKAEGLPISVETCPHYLFFEAEKIEDGDTRFKCAPPIRDHANREALWQGLRDGIIDLIASDHSPCPPHLKRLDEGDFGRAWGGISSLQLGLPVVWTQAQARGFGLEDVSRWMSSRPAKLLGIDAQKGAMAPGMDADFVVWEPENSFEVKAEWLQTRHKLTPYEGRKLKGRVQSVRVRGVQVVENGALCGVLSGLELRRS